MFETHRQSQYTQELLFSTVVELMMLVAVGLRPSLHAAARQAGDLLVALAALYDKVRPHGAARCCGRWCAAAPSGSPPC